MSDSQFPGATPPDEGPDHVDPASQTPPSAPQPASSQPPAPVPDPVVPPQAPPAAPAAPAYARAPQAPAYDAAPGYAPAAPPRNPGRVLGIVAFVMSFFGGINLIALILGIVALVQSKKAGFKNGFALAAIIISAVLLVLGTILIIVLVSLGVSTFNEICSQYGPGVHTYTSGGANATVTCPG